MHDIKAIRDNPAEFDRGLARRGLAPRAAEILKQDAHIREIQTSLQQMQATSNTFSTAIGLALRSGDGAKAEELKLQIATSKAERISKDAEIAALITKRDDTLAAIPNIPLDEAPDGKDEHGNVEVRRWGEPPRHNFPPRQHFDVGETLKLMDFEAAAKIAGARFVVTRGALARLERAIAQYMLDTQTLKNGYTEHTVPLLVSDKTMFGTAQLPKFADDQFRTTDGRWLIPTAEVSLTNLVRESILEEEQLLSLIHI